MFHTWQKMLCRPTMVKIPRAIGAKKADVYTVFSPDDKGCSDWVTREAINESESLKLTDNGNSRYGKFFGIEEFNWEKKVEKNKVVALRLIGFDLSEKYSRTISQTIRKEILKGGTCLACGSHSSLVVDHKNDLYNDPRVLNVGTQVVDDFQCLCNHCNLQKRQVSKDTRETKRRYPATMIPALVPFKVDFISGGFEYDENDVNAMVGTYWYDPVAFSQSILERFQTPYTPAPCSDTL